MHLPMRVIDHLVKGALKGTLVRRWENGGPHSPIEQGEVRGIYQETGSIQSVDESA